MINRDLSWTEFKEFIGRNSVKLQFIELAAKYHVYGLDGSFGFSCQIKKEEPASADQVDFETNYKNTAAANQPISPKDSAGNAYATPSLRRSSPGFTDWTVISHDFGDRTTWYQYSERVLAETLTTSDNITYQATHAHWINPHSSRLTAHRGRLFNKDGTTSDRSAYEPVIKRNGIVQTSGFTIDHAAGTVTFDASQAGQTISADYSHNDGVTGASRFNLFAKPDTDITIEHVELQFSKSTLFTPLRLEVWAGGSLADYGNFSEALYNAGYGQLRTFYRSVRDIINFCNQGQGEIPAMDGLTSSVVVFPFNYLYVQELKGSLGTLFTIKIDNDTPLSNCEMGTITFYTEMTT